ncbi:MAG: hypothetical protein OEY96_09080 [Gammaproteobacteria bacterium]|nr:hypothetical protein [Gammaproteobacteria bacterium]
MEAIKLTTPSQQDGQAILVETDPKRLSLWLKSLPFADMTRSIPEITRGIHSLNRTELPYKERLQLVEQFDLGYRQIHQYFRPVAALKVQKKEQMQTNLKQLKLLTAEMAFAYKIIVNDCIQNRKFWGNNKIKIKAIAFAIHYLGLMLIEQYEKYSPIPIYIWREINSLFAYSSKHELQHIEIETGNDHCLNTIEQNYLKNCLIALADPYHLGPGEHWQVLHYLQNNLNLSRISEDPDDFRKSECFIIDVTSEQKPNFVTSELDDPEDPKIRLLLTVDLIKQLSFHLGYCDERNKLPENSFHQSISLSDGKRLIRHLLLHWRNRVERNARRYPIVTKVDSVWGIHNICHVLSTTQNSGGARLTLEDLTNKSNIESSSVWNASNVSSGGIGLHNHRNLIGKIAIGELVLIREYIDGKPAKHWRLSVCCWHTGDNHKGTSIGLKYIDGHYSPVRLVLHQGKSAKGGLPAILVTDASVKESSAPTLVTSRGTYQGDRAFAMVGYQEPVEIRPRVHVDVTAKVERFFYQTYELKPEILQKINASNIEDLPWTAIPHDKGHVYDEFEEIEKVKPLTLDDIRLPGDY